MSAVILRAIAEARRAGQPQLLAELIPYARWMGFAFERDGDGVVGSMAFEDKLIGNPRLPALHGGAVGALLESTAVCDLLWRTDTVSLPKVITITIDYLRSGKPEATRATAEVTRLGRRVANVRAIAWQADRACPIAVANAHFLLVTAE